MSSALPLLARLGEAASFPKAVSAYESDPWMYMKRKLEECEQPLRDYKQVLYDRAVEALLVDLKEPFLKPGALMDHKEAFEKLLRGADFADLAFNLEPGQDPATRRENVKQVLVHAKPKTLFDVEKLPPERRGKTWETAVADVWKRLELDRLDAIMKRAKRTERSRRAAVRRARRNLGEFMSVARGDQGLRDDMTLFVLTRVEAAIAANLRFLSSN